MMRDEGRRGQHGESTARNELVRVHRGCDAPDRAIDTDELDDLFNTFGSAGIEVIDSEQAYLPEKPFDRTSALGHGHHVVFIRADCELEKAGEERG